VSHKRKGRYKNLSFLYIKNYLNINTMDDRQKDNKFLEGSEVFAKANPSIALIIRRYLDKIYYCKVKEDPSQEEQVYFEREIQQ